MRVAIVGSRGFHPLEWVIDFVNQLPIDTVVVTGDAAPPEKEPSNVDQVAERAARVRGLEVAIWWPDWTRYGKRAGPLRNTQIVDDCDVLFAFWDGTSKGTADSITKARAAGKIRRIFRCDAGDQ